MRYWERRPIPEKARSLKAREEKSHFETEELEEVIHCMGEMLTTSVQQRWHALERIGGNIEAVSADISDHLLAEHHVFPGVEDYLELFASHMVAVSSKYPEPERVIVYDSAERNRGAVRAKRASFGGKRWAKDVTG